MNIRYRFAQIGFIVLCVMLCSISFVAYAVEEESPLGQDGSGVVMLGGEENAYVLEENVVVSNTLDGDVLALAGTMTVGAAVSGDIWVAANTVTVNDRVRGDIRGISQQLHINSAVDGELLVMSSFLDISKDGSVVGRIIAGVDTAVIQGSVGGDMLLYGGTVEVYGQVNGDLSVPFAEKIIIHPGGSVAGDVRYGALDAEVLSIADGATVSGSVEFERTEKESAYSVWTDILSRFIIPALLGLLAFVLLRRRWVGYLRGSFGSVAIDVLIGLASIPAAFIIALISLMLPGAIIIGATLFLGVCVLLFCGIISSPVIVGALAESVYMKKMFVSWRSVPIGAGVLFLLSFIPIVGGIVMMLCAFFIAGRCIRCTIEYLSKSAT